MKKASIIVLIFLAQVLRGQDNIIMNLQKESQKVIKLKSDGAQTKKWQKGILYNLTFSQASLSNWSAGGDKFSLSVGSILNMYARYSKDKMRWDNNFDFNLGYVNSTSLGSRKNDDRFDLVSKVGYSVNAKSNLAFLTNLRSGFFKGYTFSGAKKNFISSFMSPGYLLSSAGWDFRPNKNISLFLSPFTARWVFVTNPELSQKGLYGVKPGQNLNFELGAYATINYLKEISPNVVYKTKLDLFSNYRNNPQNIDVFMTNVLSVKISKLFNVTWAVDLIYDDDAKLFGQNKNAPALQFKSLVGLGIQLKK
ncbi:MAG: DUF3078 domain-containing protein [Chitinophagaceae bacterium]